jgi:hypothetical protein
VSPAKRRPPAATRGARRSAADQAQIGAIVPDRGDTRARVELAAECAGCGTITEPMQGSSYCWSCVYEGEPA